MWDKDSCADAGFLKIDLLGLGMLSAVERCVELIAHAAQRARGPLAHPLRRPPTYDAIQNAETTGVFQIESRAQMGSLLRTRPKTLEDLTIQVAIVRPGPIQGGAVNPYIARLQALRADPSYEVPYDHPWLKEVLKETLGTIIFQDQVIEVAMAFAGFSPGEAEGLRRAMSRKRSARRSAPSMSDFVEGARVTNGADAERTAERVWTMIVGFSGFGFPKAHGAAFGLLAYQSTWLRVHYGPEFLCSLLDEQPMGFYPPDALVHDAQRRGIEVLAPDVNRSAVGCTVDAPHPAVRVGLGYVLGVRADEVAALVAAREAGGSVPLAGATSRRAPGRAARRSSGWPGRAPATRSSPARRAARRRLWRSAVVAPRAGACGEDGTQLSLPLELPGAPALERLGSWDSMIADYATTGLTTGPHPLGLLRAGCAARAGDERGPARHAPRRRRRRRRDRRRPPAPRNREGHRVHAARGRGGHDQPGRAARGLRARPLVVRTEPLVVAEGRAKATVLIETPPGGLRNGRDLWTS